MRSRSGKDSAPIPPTRRKSRRVAPSQRREVERDRLMSSMGNLSVAVLRTDAHQLPFPVLAQSGKRTPDRGASLPGRLLAPLDRRPLVAGPDYPPVRAFEVAGCQTAVLLVHELAAAEENHLSTLPDG